MELVGGQAVIEGVMMRFKNNVVTAVRDPHGKIVFKSEKVKSLTSKAPFSWPFVRGAAAIVDTLTVGMRSLNYSADVALKDEKETKSDNSWIVFALSITLSIAFAIALFKFVPLLLTQLITGSSSLSQNKYAFNFIEGLIKLGVFVSYVLLIGQMKDIKRVFQYHGAEHKAVNCHEAKEELTIDNAKKFSTINPRCGTSFMLFVILISIFVYVIIPLDINFFAKLGLRIALLPVIASISYELLKVGAKYRENPLFLVINAPGLWVQKLTTGEPDDKQLEVALFSLKKVLKSE